MRPGNHDRHRDDVVAVPGHVDEWLFDFATADGSLAGWVAYVHLGDHAWYQATVVRPGQPILAVIDHEVPLRSSPLEVRTTGLWADHVCETPFDHWTVGLEAYSVGVDEPEELLGEARGELVGLGFDVEWETVAGVVDAPGPLGVDGYGIPCRVTGEVLVGASRFDIDAVGTRWHHWGDRLSGPVALGVQAGAALEGGRRWVHRSASGRGIDVITYDDASLELRRSETVSGADVTGRLAVSAADEWCGRPRAVTAAPGGIVAAVDVLAVTPMPTPDRDAGWVRWRMLCRLRLEDGTLGLGWADRWGGPAGAGLRSR